MIDYSKLYLKHLEELTKCKSVTPKSDGAIEYIENLLKTHGFQTEIKIFGKQKDSLTMNLYAEYGNGSPNICFGGHVDVVPPGDLSQWHIDPFKLYQKDGNIYCRGAVDMKGALSCMLSAATEFIKTNQGFKGKISFLITSDEEGSGDHGTKEMLEYIKKKGHSIDLAIVGEPTSVKYVGDTIKIGRRGSINFCLKIKGTQGHVAYPKDASNPVPIMLKAMNELINTTLDEGSEFFESSNLEITSIDVGNEVNNVIPEEVVAKFNIRFNDNHTMDSLVSMVGHIVRTHSKSSELSYTCSSHPFVQSPIGLIDEFTKSVAHSTKLIPQLSTNGGTSDARFFKNYCKVVELGLLSKTAHKINEYTTISDLQTLHNVYYDSLCKFLKPLA